MSPTEWAKFLHRLGFGTTEDDSQSGSEQPDVVRGESPPPPSADDLPDLPGDADDKPDTEKKE
jgi:hypothetical protein